MRFVCRFVSLCRPLAHLSQFNAVVTAFFGSSPTALHGAFCGELRITICLSVALHARIRTSCAKPQASQYQIGALASIGVFPSRLSASDCLEACAAGNLSPRDLEPCRNADVGAAPTFGCSNIRSEVVKIHLLAI